MGSKVDPTIKLMLILNKRGVATEKEREVTATAVEPRPKGRPKTKQPMVLHKADKKLKQVEKRKSFGRWANHRHFCGPDYRETFGFLQYNAGEERPWAAVCGDKPLIHRRMTMEEAAEVVECYAERQLKKQEAGDV